MKLVLHIGCHKTGTAAIQSALKAADATLLSTGYYYAAPNRAVQANDIADALHAGRIRHVRRFFGSQVSVAQHRGAHTMIVSAENFFGMSIVAALHARSMHPDPVHSDRRSITRLARTISGLFESTQILCYLRRPDRFAESWYNQNVKGSALISFEFSQFLELVRPLLSYSTFLDSWAEVFGSDNVVVEGYEPVAHDVVPAFAALVMGAASASALGHQAVRRNERLDRDVLEFKRMINPALTQRTKPLDYEVLSRLVARWPAHAAPANAQEFLTPRERADLLAELAADEAALRSTYGLTPFPSFDLTGAAASWDPYTGLRPEAEARLRSIYNDIARDPRLRLRRTALKRGVPNPIAKRLFR